MKVVLSRDMETVKFLEALPRDEFRQKFLRKVAQDMSFTYVLDDPHAGPESFQRLHDLMIDNGIPEALIVSDRAIQEAAQAIINRIMELLVS